MESNKPSDPYPDANPDLIPEADHNGNEPNPSGHNRSNRGEEGKMTQRSRFATDSAN